MEIADMPPSPSNLTNTHQDDIASNELPDQSKDVTFEALGSLDDLLSAPDFPDSNSLPDVQPLQSASASPIPSTSKSPPDQSHFMSSTSSLDQLDQNESDSESQTLPNAIEYLALEKNVISDHNYPIAKNLENRADNGLLISAFDFELLLF